MPECCESIYSTPVATFSNSVIFETLCFCIHLVINCFYYRPSKIDVIESQRASINYTNWKEKKDTLLFWYEVQTFKDSSGYNPFQELVEFVISILILPFSNADVERLFSEMNIIKTKKRNRIGKDTLISILSIKEGLKLGKKHCYDYKLPSSVVSKIGTNESYEKKNETTRSDSESDIEIIE